MRSHLTALTHTWQAWHATPGHGVTPADVRVALWCIVLLKAWILVFLLFHCGMILCVTQQCLIAPTDAFQFGWWWRVCLFRIFNIKNMQGVVGGRAYFLGVPVEQDKVWIKKKITSRWNSVVKPQQLQLFEVWHSWISVAAWWNCSGITGLRTDLCSD